MEAGPLSGLGAQIGSILPASASSPGRPNTGQHSRAPMNPHQFKNVLGDGGGEGGAAEGAAGAGEAAAGIGGELAELAPLALLA